MPTRVPSVTVKSSEVKSIVVPPEQVSLFSPMENFGMWNVRP